MLQQPAHVQRQADAIFSAFELLGVQDVFGADARAGDDVSGFWLCRAAVRYGAFPPPYHSAGVVCMQRGCTEWRVLNVDFGTEWWVVNGDCDTEWRLRIVDRYVSAFLASPNECASRHRPPQTEKKAGAVITRPRPNTVERKKKEIFSYPSSRIP